MAAPLAAPVVVVGAGAAGLMAALFAARAASGGATPSRPVLLLERTRDGGRKILISGGGRCNILPSHVDERRFVTDSSAATLRNILRSWPLAEQIAFFENEAGIPLALEEESGKLFPRSNRARDVRDRLLALVRDAGAEARFDARVTDVVAQDGGWSVTLEGAPPIAASSVVLATGGLSVPNTGSDGLGLDVARRLGHRVHQPYPALTPLTADPPPYADLAGISLPVRLEAAGDRVATEGGFLFTHRGYSGPAVLDISHVAVRARRAGTAQAIVVRWSSLDEAAWERALQEGGTTHVGTLVRRHLPTRLADRLLADIALDGSRPLAQLRRDERRVLVDTLVRHPLPWSGDEGYRKAEVTGGGVALEEVDPRTMESRRHPGLFLSGEMLDAFGPIGGNNFLWAWATGRAAGIGAASASRRARRAETRT